VDHCLRGDECPAGGVGLVITSWSSSVFLAPKRLAFRTVVIREGSVCVSAGVLWILGFISSLLFGGLLTLGFILFLLGRRNHWHLFPGRLVDLVQQLEREGNDHKGHMYDAQ
jgi:hypothetical protein